MTACCHGEWLNGPLVLFPWKHSSWCSEFVARPALQHEIDVQEIRHCLDYLSHFNNGIIQALAFAEQPERQSHADAITEHLEPMRHALRYLNYAMNRLAEASLTPTQHPSGSGHGA